MSTLLWLQLCTARDECLHDAAYRVRVRLDICQSVLACCSFLWAQSSASRTASQWHAYSSLHALSAGHV